MTRPERLEVIAKAKLLFYYHGRGCVLHLRDRMDEDEDRYSSVEEIREALAEETDAKALVAAAMWAVGTYDPINQAVVLQSLEEVIRVLIVKADCVEDVGGLDVLPDTEH